MTTADRAQDALQTAGAAQAAARPAPLPRWVPAVMAGSFAGGFALLAVTSWTMQWWWALAGVALCLVFLVGVWKVSFRDGLRVRPRRDPRRHLVDGSIVLVSLVVFAFDQGAGLLLLGLGLGTTAWLQFSRVGRA